MPETILLLTLEHKNMARLFDLLDELATRMDQGEEPDWDLLGIVADYLTGYPDRCHHPKEDLLLHKLRAKDADAARGLDQLLVEHGELSDLSGEFAVQVERAREEPGLDHDELQSLMHRYVDVYRGHMAMEESLFFPAAQRAFSRADWQEIDFRIFDGRDPLFDPDIEDRYRELRLQIARVAEHKKNWQSDWLNRITGIREFNRSQQFAGQQIRLVPRSQGGYDLERWGRRIVSFPECDEIRAVWCAYYFLEGENMALLQYDDGDVNAFAGA